MKIQNNYGIIRFSAINDSAGFFSNYFSIVSSIGPCLRQNLIPYVDASNTWFNPSCDFENNKVLDSNINPWNWWFEQSIGKDSTVVEIPLYRGSIVHNPQVFNNQGGLDYHREIASKYCRVKSSIQEEEDNEFRNLIEGKKTLGILARGTEMLLYHLEYPKVYAEGWVGIIQNYLAHHPDIENIFVVSDDNEILEAITSNFSNVSYIKHYFRKTDQPLEMIENKLKPWWLFSPTEDPNHRERVGREVLIQAKLLARCDYFIGSCSGISNAVQFFNSNKFINSIIV